MYVCMHIYIHMYIYVMYIYIYICICTHTYCVCNHIFCLFVVDSDRSCSQGPCVNAQAACGGPPSRPLPADRRVQQRELYKGEYTVCKGFRQQKPAAVRACLSRGCRRPEGPPPSANVLQPAPMQPSDRHSSRRESPGRRGSPHPRAGAAPPARGPGPASASSRCSCPRCLR